jgi:hypothetical protein
MLSEKLLIGIGVDTLPAKTAIGGVNPLLCPLASLLSAPWPSRQVQAVISELFHLKNETPTGTGARADLRKRSVPRRLTSPANSRTANMMATPPKIQNSTNSC